MNSTQEIGFFNPIYPTFKGPGPGKKKVAWLGRIVEPYFDFGQQSYRVLSSTSFLDDSVLITENKKAPSKSWTHTAGCVALFTLKLISYLTVIIPIALLVAKLVYREENQFSLQETISEEQLRDRLAGAKKILESTEFTEKFQKLDFTDFEALQTSLDLLNQFDIKHAEFSALLGRFSLPDEDTHILKSALELLENLKKNLNAHVENHKDDLTNVMIKAQVELEAKFNTHKQSVQVAIETKVELEKIQEFIKQFKTFENPILLNYTLLKAIDFIVIPKGICNLGATCFMNSAVQTLIANPVYRQRIKDRKPPVYQTIRNEMIRQLSLVNHNEKPLFKDTERVVDCIFNEWQTFSINDLKSHADEMNEKGLAQAFDALILEQKLECAMEKVQAVAVECPLAGVDASTEPPVEEADLSPRAQEVVQKLKESFPLEEPLLLVSQKDIGWKLRKHLLHVLKINLQDYARSRLVMERFDAFIMKYEEESIKPADLEQCSKDLRAALHYAGVMPDGLSQQNDASPVIEYILDAIGASLPLSVKRKVNDLESVQRDSISMIQLEIDKKASNNNLQDLVNQFSVEVTSGGLTTMGEKNTCTFKNGDNQDVTVNQWNELWRLEGAPPPFLQIQLKRFYNDSKGNRVKIDNPVIVDSLEVDMSPLFNLPTEEKARYLIKSVVIHRGSLTSGHYYSMVEKAGIWSKCNDEVISTLKKPKEELSSGYIYF